MIKILKFESDSCPQCKALSVTLKRITKEYKIDIKSIDIEEDNNQDLIRKYNIRSISVAVLIVADFGIDVLSSFNIVFLKQLLNNVSFSFGHYDLVYRFLFSSCHNKRPPMIYILS